MDERLEKIWVKKVGVVDNTQHTPKSTRKWWSCHFSPWVGTLCQPCWGVNTRTSQSAQNTLSYQDNL